jgi:hypothetical protein
MRVIEAAFRRRPIVTREHHEGARYSFVTWGSFATFIVGCTIVGTALFLGTRMGGSP